MIDHAARFKQMMERAAPNGVPLRLLNGLLEPPVVEGAQPLPNKPANAPAPFRREPRQVAEPPKAPEQRKTRSVLKKEKRK